MLGSLGSLSIIHSNIQGLVVGGWMESLATFGIALDSTSY